MAFEKEYKHKTYAEGIKIKTIDLTDAWYITPDKLVIPRSMEETAMRVVNEEPERDPLERAIDSAVDEIVKGRTPEKVDKVHETEYCEWPFSMPDKIDYFRIKEENK